MQFKNRGRMPAVTSRPWGSPAGWAAPQLRLLDGNSASYSGKQVLSLFQRERCVLTMLYKVEI